MKIQAQCIALLACTLFLNGCAQLLGLDGFQPTYNEISNDAASWRAFSKNGIYTVLKPLYLVTGETKDHGGDQLVPSEPNDWSCPSCSESYIPATMPSSPDELKKYPFIKAILGVDTHLQAIGVIEMKWVEAGTTWYVMKILDGPFAGTTCHIDAMTGLASVKNPHYVYGKTPVYIPGPNPKYLTAEQPSNIPAN